jgi:hypothetical protein
MNDDRTNIIVSQQRRDLVFGDWASATIFVPRRVWIGDKLLHHLLRCYFRAVLGEHRPQSRQQLYSDAWLIWSAREVNRRPTCLHPDSPWHEYRGRGPITKNQVAALLRDYDIRPVVVHPTKRADFSRHGYRAAQFEDAFARFLPHEPNIRTLKSGRERM